MKGGFLFLVRTGTFLLVTMSMNTLVATSSLFVVTIANFAYIKHEGLHLVQCLSFIS